jgi:hypothetical protein
MPSAAEVRAWRFVTSANAAYENRRSRVLKSPVSRALFFSYNFSAISFFSSPAEGLGEASKLPYWQSATLQSEPHLMQRPF